MAYTLRFHAHITFTPQFISDCPMKILTLSDFLRPSNIPLTIEGKRHHTICFSVSLPDISSDITPILWYQSIENKYRVVWGRLYIISIQMASTCMFCQGRISWGGVLVLYVLPGPHKLGGWVFVF